jgi:hypothetical protein
VTPAGIRPDPDAETHGQARRSGAQFVDEAPTLPLLPGLEAGGTAFLIVDAEHGLAVSLLANVTGNTVGPALQELVWDIQRGVGGGGGVN